jgi:hypothetical protein
LINKTMDIVVNSPWGQKTTKTTLHLKNWFKIGEAPRLQGGASRSLIILFRYMPLDSAYKVGLARHETGQKFAGVMN